MLKIDNEALNYFKDKKLCFVVRLETTPIECDCCSGAPKNIKALKTMVLFETEVLDKECYDTHEYEGVKVFISKDLKVASDINVYHKAKIPFMKPKFGIKGVTT